MCAGRDNSRVLRIRSSRLSWGSLLGRDAGAASTIGRPKDAWSNKHLHWNKRYLSADGFHVRQCLLVIIGATREGKEELTGLATGLAKNRPTHPIGAGGGRCSNFSG
jgi:hypothetical protein